jgi:hypothetical protein
LVRANASVNVGGQRTTGLDDGLTERFECWNRGELDLMQAMYAEDGAFDVSAVFTDVAPARGHESMRRYRDEVWRIGVPDVPGHQAATDGSMPAS